MRAESDIPSQVWEEAAEWFVDFRVDQVAMGTRDEFCRWLRRSPQHIQAYLEVARTYTDLAAAKDKVTLILDEMLARAQTDAGADILHLRTGSRTNSDPPRRGLMVTALAGVLITIGGIIGAALWRSHYTTTISTGIGEQRSINLSDG